jgi:hypothetical protein
VRAQEWRGGVMEYTQVQPVFQCHFTNSLSLWECLRRAVAYIFTNTWLSPFYF